MIEALFSGGVTALTTGVILTAFAVQLGASNAMVGVLASGPLPDAAPAGPCPLADRAVARAQAPERRHERGRAAGARRDGGHIYASGNIAADMYCIVAAESTGRVLATRLYNAAHDEGMKDMLHYMIARDTMHQQQWLAVIEELRGAAGTLPIPNSFPQAQEDNRNNYNCYVTAQDGSYPEGRWTSGPAIDGKGEFTVFENRPLGEEPMLGSARPDSGAQTEQIAPRSVA